MHLGYHELRNMLQKFREEREKRKMAPPPASAPSGAPGGGPARSGSERGADYRSSRGDDYRDRDRGGYDRHGSSSRYEYVTLNRDSFTFMRLELMFLPY